MSLGRQLASQLYAGRLSGYAFWEQDNIQGYLLLHHSIIMDFALDPHADPIRVGTALLQRAATMFTPPKAGNAANGYPSEGNAGARDASSEMMWAPGTSAEIKALSDKIEDLQKQICALVEARPPKA